MAAIDGGADGAIASDTPTYAALLDSDDLSDDDEDFDPASYVLPDAEISAAFGGDATDRLAMFERLGWTRSPRRASEVGTQPVAQDSPDQLRNADDPGVYELPGYISNEEEDEEDELMRVHRKPPKCVRNLQKWLAVDYEGGFRPTPLLAVVVSNTVVPGRCSLECRAARGCRRGL